MHEGQSSGRVTLSETAVNSKRLLWLWLITQTRWVPADAATEAILAYTYSGIMLVLHTTLASF